MFYFYFISLLKIKHIQMKTITDTFYVASMPEIKIAATGSSYEEALDNLLIAASASSGNEPLSDIRTF
jgi:hypothetical protein